MKIRDLTPVPQFGVGGTDLGIPVRMPTGEIGFFFGDTFAENRVGGPGWRSPVLLYSHTHDLDDGGAISPRGRGAIPRNSCGTTRTTTRSSARCSRPTRS